MKKDWKWVIIEDCISTRSTMFETITDATNAAEAEQIARAQWNGLAKCDQRDRDAFFVGLCKITPEIETGEAYYTDTMTDIIRIK